MLTKIALNKIASFKSVAALDTDKKINLIYGLNGTGKSTFSNYLHKQTDEKYKDCSIHGLDSSHDIIVYNQTFIQDTFFESENLKGIFTLSKENKEAETKIANALKEIQKLETGKEGKTEELEKENSAILQKQEVAKNAVWKIKTDYSGGDRVLEFCLEGYKGSKDSLFSHVFQLTKPTSKPTKSIEDLKNDLQSISGDNAQKYSGLSQITFTPQNIESDALFAKQIVGNENSTVSRLIKGLGNSDWVKAGLRYLPTEPTEENSTCPFCQENTISATLVESIKNYFDASYEADINSLNSFLSNYFGAIQSIPNKSVFEANPKFDAFKKDFELKYNAFAKVVEDNKKLIDDKIKTPSIPLNLQSSTQSLQELNDVIKQINALVLEHNKNIDQKETVKSNIKKTFWQVMRWDYDQTINSYNTDKNTSKSKTDTLDKSIKEYEAKIYSQNKIIADQQKETVNIKEAITNINNSLIDLGITDFNIKHHSENLYKIARGENQDKIFRSLSEGEKMIISFLYFIELCRGKKEATETGKKKVVIIDNPISSLSHIYVFNVGRLIKNEFFGTKEIKTDPITGEKVTTWQYKYEQVFILTHSLYFFYEITETNHDVRKEIQKLFRLMKNENGSAFVPMSYEEIQNDYQAYWFIIKDDKQPAALIANCMRNIIEYFFNFVEKKDLNSFFAQSPLNSNKFQAFYRYINRESHSLGQNIFDFKEFNYADFKEAFAELFKAAGYEAHYKKMIK